MITRRSALLSGAGYLGLLTSPLWAQATLPKHQRDSLKNGQLIWVRGVNEAILYTSDREADDFEKRLDEEVASNPDLLKQYPVLEDLDYEEFSTGYFHDEDITGEVQFSGAGEAGVGHVAILKKEGSRYFVLEAIGKGRGTGKTSLEDWLSAQKREAQFWTGEFRDFSDAQVSEVIKIIESEIEAGKPYDFWNFDLEDSSGFYCSKLIWFGVYKATGKKLDVGLRKELPWYSPKQMQKSPYIKMIAYPGKY